jgi:hypothetical protein
MLKTIESQTFSGSSLSSLEVFKVSVQGVSRNAVT